MEAAGAPDGGVSGERDGIAGGPRRRSRWWYLAPLLLAIVGGVVAYFALRHDDTRLARRCLVLGVGLTAVQVAVQAALAIAVLGP